MQIIIIRPGTATTSGRLITAARPRKEQQINIERKGILDNYYFELSIAHHIGQSSSKM